MRPRKAQVPMVRFEGGTFTQGRKEGHKYESPPKKGVKVEGFLLDAVEVSRGRYAAYLARAGAAVRSPWGKSRTPPAGTADLPVTGVTWKEATAFCAAGSKRLPTETEWEYAARGPSHDKLYPWGDRFDPERVVSSVRKPGKLQPVRSGQPTGGVYHLVGNAWEWVSTRYEPYPGSRAGRAFGTQYVIRGGGADTRKPERLTATYRVFNYGHRNPRTKKLATYKYLGFRCARDLQQGEE
jgi:formylglycine-generating enzyme required for sulfatase activity